MAGRILTLTRKQLFTAATDGQNEAPFPYGVYLIAPVRGRWPVKIGVSIEPVKRLNALQTSHWERLGIIKFWNCRTRSFAFKIENKAHRMLADKSMSGEWFDVDALTAEMVVEDAANALQISIREMSCGKRFEKDADRFVEV